MAPARPRAIPTLRRALTVMDLGARASLAAYEQGQERIHDAVVGACMAGGGLSAVLEPPLAAALSLLASDADLAWLVSVWPEGADADVWRRRSEWWTSYGTLLRGAAEREGAGLPPFFVEPMLIGGVAFLVSRHVRGAGAGDLEQLLPSIHWYLLSYYDQACPAAAPRFAR